MEYFNYLFSDIVGTTNIIVAPDGKSVIYCRYDKQMEEVCLMCLGVQEDAQKQGRGTAMIREAEKWAYEYGAIEISIECQHDLVPFFERLGYNETYSDYCSTFMRKKFEK